MPLEYIGTGQIGAGSYNVCRLDFDMPVSPDPHPV